MMLRLGMRFPRAQAGFKMSTVLRAASLPAPPARTLNRTRVTGANVGMLGNDEYGDCVWAGAAHETMYWSKVGGKPAAFTTASVLGDYAACTGFDPSKTDAAGNNPTDQGTDPVDAASYRRKTGLADATGARHLISAYLGLQANNVQQIKLALSLFGPVGWGLALPRSAEDQFNQQLPWSVVASDPEPTDGHYVSVYDINSRGNLLCWTWGRDQAIEPGFVLKYGIIGLAYVDLEELDKTTGLTPENFDKARLLAMLAELGS